MREGARVRGGGRLETALPSCFVTAVTLEGHSVVEWSGMARVLRWAKWASLRNKHFLDLVLLQVHPHLLVRLLHVVQLLSSIDFWKFG